MKALFVIAALLLLVSTNVQSQPGSLNTAFGNNGASLSDLSSGNRYEESATGVFVQQDGKRVVVVDRYPIIQLIRFNADGSYDNSYGQGGFSQAVNLSHFGGPNSNAAMQSDGKMVVTGETPANSTTRTDIGVARWNTDGTLDATFGGTGVVTTALPDWEEGDVVQIRSDGKIVVAGEVLTPTNEHYLVFARYNANGTPDASFGSQGSYVNHSFEGIGLNDMKLTPGGDIMVLGNDFGNSQGVLARFLPSGIDVTFTSDGYEEYDWSSTFGGGFGCMEILSDGRILLGGSRYNGTDSDFLVARYNANGTIDNTFNGTGFQTTAIAGNEVVYDLALQSDGKIVAAGSVYSSSLPMSFALARYAANGDLDATFGKQGTQVTSFSGYDGAAATNVTIGSDGDITAAGGARKGLFAEDVAVATYDVQGTPAQDGFPVQRIIAYYADNGVTDFRALALQPDGKLVAAGYIWNGIDDDYVIARFNTNGTPDLSFGTNGHQITQFTATGKGTEVALALAIQGDGKILAAGWFQDFTTTYTYVSIARYNANGSLDATFDGDGMKLVNFPGIFEEGHSIVIQPDGKILVGGDDDNADWDFALLRLNADGSLDGGFGTGGMVTTTFGYQDEIWGLALQSDGKILATGNTSLPNSFDGFDFCTVRYNSNGSVDQGFGTDGRVTTDFGGGTDFAQAIVLQSDGKFVVAGGVPISKDYQFGLARYNSNGTPDATFGNSGVQTTSFVGYDIGNAIVLESTGKLDVAGFTEGTGGNPTVDLALARYNTSGALDADFGNAGKVTTDFGGQESAFSMGLFNKKIYVAGFKRVFNAFTITDKYYGLAASYFSESPQQEVQDVVAEINALSIASGTKTSLNSKLQAVVTCLAAGDISCACSRLQDFINEVKAQAGKKKISSAQATQLIAEAINIMSDLGCGLGKAVEAAPEIPNQFVLDQNYPNPFNPTTVIRYGLPQKSTVTLVVYNILGEVVTELVNGEMEAGYHNVSFNASGLSSGVYFYKIRAGDFLETKKLLLVR